MLVVNQMRKVYPTRTGGFEAIADFTFTVNSGEFFTIVGPSGAGKTTLLRCLSGLIDVTSGSVSFNGTVVTGAPPREFAVVFQDYARSLLPWFTVARNVELPLRAARVPADERRSRVEHALASVGLDHVGDKHPGELSGGMQQRVALARAIAYRPKLLIMDEPFASVDAQTRFDLEDLVLRLQEETRMSVVLVTHDVDEAVYLSNRVAIVTKSPSRIDEIVDVDLPAERNQLETKHDHRFGELRSHVLMRIRNMVHAEAVT